MDVGADRTVCASSSLTRRPQQVIDHPIPFRKTRQKCLPPRVVVKCNLGILGNKPWGFTQDHWVTKWEYDSFTTLLL